MNCQFSTINYQLKRSYQLKKTDNENTNNNYNMHCAKLTNSLC